MLLVRTKIAAVVAKGGIPDPDAPGDVASTRYWVHLGMEESTQDETRSSVTFQGHITGQAAMAAFGVRDNVPQAAAPVADPLAVVRQQLQNVAVGSQEVPARHAYVRILAAFNVWVLWFIAVRGRVLTKVALLA